MNISVNCGHTISGVGTGAVGYFNESEHTRILGKKVISLLQKRGHTVINSTVNKATTTNDSLKKIVDIVNNSNADLFVSIHFNSIGNNTANGSEIFTYSGDTNDNICNNILNNLSKIGFKNRGIKKGNHLYVIRNTKPKALLIEVCFVSNLNDSIIYAQNVDNIALAIVNGLVGEQKMENKTAVEFEKAKNEMIKLGVTDGTRPKDNVTREEVWTMLNRLYNKLKG